jgi:hypothetical protein
LFWGIVQVAVDPVDADDPGEGDLVGVLWQAVADNASNSVTAVRNLRLRIALTPFVTYCWRSDVTVEIRERWSHP